MLAMSILYRPTSRKWFSMRARVSQSRDRRRRAPSAGPRRPLCGDMRRKVLVLGNGAVLTSISSFDSVVVELRLLRQQKDPGLDKGVELRLL